MPFSRSGKISFKWGFGCWGGGEGGGVICSESMCTIMTKTTITSEVEEAEAHQMTLEQNCCRGPGKLKENEQLKRKLTPLL